MGEAVGRLVPKNINKLNVWKLKNYYGNIFVWFIHIFIVKKMYVFGKWNGVREIRGYQLTHWSGGDIWSWQPNKLLPKRVSEF